jgi:hypothetical protein
MAKMRAGSVAELVRRRTGVIVPASPSGLDQGPLGRPKDRA